MINWCGYKWDSVMEGGRRIHTGQPWEWYCDECAYVDSDNVLHLKIMEKPTEIHHWDGNTYNPTMAVGIIRTRNPFDYGTFSCDLKMPKGLNLSASFWLSGDKSWPPEIDIEEGWSENGRWFHIFTSYFPWFCPSWRTTSNVHYLDEKGDKTTKTHAGSRNIPWCKQKHDPTENWVTYTCTWTPDKIEFFADGVLVRTIEGDIPKKLVENNYAEGHLMDAILNIWTGDPETCTVRMDTEFLARNFKYAPLEK